MEAVIGAVPDGSPPSTFSVSAFSHGVFDPPLSTTVADCGLQKMEIFEDGAHTPMLYSQILTGASQVSDATESMNLVLQSNDDSHAGDYYPKVQITLLKYNTVVYVHPIDFLVRLKPGCHNDNYSTFVWAQNGATHVPQFTHVLGEDSGQVI